jgi:hypothetical protein
MMLETIREICMFSARKGLSMCLWVLLSACGSSDENAAEQRELPAPKDTFAGDLISAKDKAKAVEDTLQQQKEERDRQMQEAESAGNP